MQIRSETDSVPSHSENILGIFHQYLQFGNQIFVSTKSVDVTFTN